MTRYIINGVNIHTVTKIPAYPLHIPVYVKLDDWKNYRSGTIIIDGADRIDGSGYYPKVNSYKTGFIPCHFFITELTKHKYSLTPDIGVVKTKNGKIWNPFDPTFN